MSVRTCRQGLGSLESVYIRTRFGVSEVHKQWGNEKRECVCLSLGLRFSLGAIKDDEHEGSPSLHIAFLLRKTDFTSVKLNRER